MSTINGCGTSYYGWKHEENGVATATNWIVLFMFPVFPLERVRLRVISSDDRFVRGGVDRIQILEVLERDYCTIIKTLFAAYFLFPVALILPMVFLLVGVNAAENLGYMDSESALDSIFRVFAGFNLIYWILLGVYVLRRSRGRTSL